MTERVPAVFYFEFHLDPEYHEGAAPADPAHPTNADHLITYAFAGTIPADKVAEAMSGMDNMEGWYENLLADQEEKGVHNWTSFPDARVLCLGGYHGYEIAPADVRTHMESWRSALSEADKSAGIFGPVVALPDCPEGDYEIYEAAIAAGSVAPTA